MGIFPQCLTLCRLFSDGSSLSHVVRWPNFMRLILANFKMHLAGAIVAGGASAGLALSLFGAEAAPTAGLSLIAGVLGGLLPDIDHDHAVPVRELFSLLAAVIPAAIMPLLLKQGIRAEWVILSYVIAYVLIRFVVSEFFKKLTVHRGIFHSIPFLLCAGEATALALYSLPVFTRLFVGAAVSLGALMHLLLDEIYAVDFTGRHLKKSFGTAIKLWAPSKVASVICYLSLIVLTIFLWREIGA
jgi:membrane-bound metal-dependent hydrolase YbcI (DUF457 family)